MNNRHVEAFKKFRIIKGPTYNEMDVMGQIAFAIASLADAIETAAYILKDDIAEKERLLMEEE